MIGTNKTKKKRQHDRFKAQAETYAAIVNDSIKVGQILNISKGGLAFSYIAKEDQLIGWHKMNIFLSGNHFYLKELPFNAISDFLMDNNTQFSTVFMKQCGGQFGGLTSSQITQLEYFIANHTIS